MSKFYVTTYCNFAHNIETGRPINHECYILNPKALAMEAEKGAQEVLDSGIEIVKLPRRIVVGRKKKE